MKTTWENNGIQFPRLIAEADQAGAFNGNVLRTMAIEMDLTVNEVLEVVERATTKWDQIKAST